MSSVPGQARISISCPSPTDKAVLDPGEYAILAQADKSLSTPAPDVPAPFRQATGVPALDKEVASILVPDEKVAIVPVPDEQGVSVTALDEEVANGPVLDDQVAMSLPVFLLFLGLLTISMVYVDLDMCSRTSLFTEAVAGEGWICGSALSATWQCPLSISCFCDIIVIYRFHCFRV